jgi:hypothetical protein
MSPAELNYLAKKSIPVRSTRLTRRTVFIVELVYQPNQGLPLMQMDYGWVKHRIVTNGEEVSKPFKTLSSLPKVITDLIIELEEKGE